MGQGRPGGRHQAALRSQLRATREDTVPDADHRGARLACAKEIARWMKEGAAAPSREVSAARIRALSRCE